MNPLEKIYYVYVLFRPWDGSPFYVGKGKGRRWLDHDRESHRGRNKHLSNIFKKAQAQALEIPRIKIRENLTETEAFEIEIAFIRAIGRKRDGGPLVNATNGGDGTSGHVVEPCIAKSSSERMKSQWANAEYRARQVARLTGNKYTAGRKLSPEHRAKIAASLIGKPGRSSGRSLSDEHKRKLREFNSGRRHDDAAKAKIREAALGRRHSEETLIKLKLSHYGKKLSESQCRRIREGSKRFSNTAEGKLAKAAAANARWAKVRADKLNQRSSELPQENQRIGPEQ